MLAIAASAVLVNPEEKRYSKTGERLMSEKGTCGTCRRWQLDPYFSETTRIGKCHVMKKKGELKRAAERGCMLWQGHKQEERA